MSGAEPFLLAAGTAFSVVSAISSANAQSSAADRQAQVDEYNRKIADQDREQALNTSRIAADDKARENRRRLADMRANLGSTGLEFGGSLMDQFVDSSIETALDYRRTEYEGYEAARAGSIEKANYSESAAANRAKSKSALSSGYYTAGASLLSGGARTYKSFKENGY